MTPPKLTAVAGRTISTACATPPRANMSAPTRGPDDVCPPARKGNDDKRCAIRIRLLGPGRATVESGHSDPFDDDGLAMLAGRRPFLRLVRPSNQLPPGQASRGQSRRTHQVGSVHP